MTFRSKGSRLLACSLLFSLVLTGETITVDARGPVHPFPHFWEQIFGSGRAILSLRESYRRDLRLMKQSTSIEYVRFHAIFQDETGLYDEDANGQPVYNYSYIDQIYDGLLENGVRPFVELSFMPRKLAASQTPHAFWYKQLPNPPKDYGRWEELVYEFTKHLVDRYGVDEVSRWYFEVWNEPNIDFWTGKPAQATYFELYDHAARAVKRANADLRVGGPATAQAAWVDAFIQHCVSKKIPVDFVSTHVYANDTAHDVLGTEEKRRRSEMVARAVRKVYNQVQHSARPEMPIIWSEYNASYMNEVDVTDSPFMGPWLANNIRQCAGMVTSMAYWSFSDVFEEQGVVKKPFYGGYGLIAVGGIPKAAFNAFALLHQLGTQRLDVASTSALVTVRTNGSLAIAVWNYAEPGEAGAPKQVQFAFQHLSGQSHLRVQILDREHGSALTAWEALGRPDSPTRDQQQQLREQAKLPPSILVPLSASIALPPHSLALVEPVP